ncbi:Ecto-ADP-ribosyltransferase 5 [Collichthys lucidus]|uniref:NAD(P)(+)--arginine ADP-ribosyltransferase n=1 Tax=Collichthys lucidus TaxID=240159 RepID=A0A4U5U423_COLLU|nr:Ecto-ADP-ribosyltransferase 5 [Collichthys lucidus]
MLLLKAHNKRKVSIKVEDGNEDSLGSCDHDVWSLFCKGGSLLCTDICRKDYHQNSVVSVLRVPLDLAPNAVDDMYSGCKDKMEDRVKNEYLANEKNKDKNFNLAWSEAEKYYNKRWNHKRGKRPSTSLGKEKIMAIYVYTLDKPRIYLDFNNAVRTQKSKYKTTFSYHSLHFFLTDALQTLNARKPEAERCLTGYRRVDSYFSQDVLNKGIRFGSFTSSSMGCGGETGRRQCFGFCSGCGKCLVDLVKEDLLPLYIKKRLMKDSETGSDDVLPLDMAPNSVDDMYDGCKDKMRQLVVSMLQDEKSKNEDFKTAWDGAEDYYNNKWKKTIPRVGKEPAIALYCYTFGAGNIHAGFNNAVRSQKSEYKTTFGYHAFHFYLTDALQKRNEPESCLTGYRRVDRYFSQDVRNKEFRFGSFTSSSMVRYPSAKRFGEKSCFEIETCYGADISMYSKFANEAEVLIPPYEVFKVTDIKKRSEKKDLPCEDSETGSDDVLPLDMAPNSVDDMYDGCKENMFKVQTEYLQDEKNKDMIFKNAWDEAEQHNRKLYGSNELKKEEIIAIYVYTLSGDELYADFNNAVRSQKSEYKITFGYHALHFYLTSALQKLDEEQKSKGRECLTSYRGVDKKFSQDVSGKEFRFGSSTSSSAGYNIARAFGRKSCFKIETCYGADISLYSKFKNEEEVLIPPYVLLKVIKIEKRSEGKSLPWCFRALSTERQQKRITKKRSAFWMKNPYRYRGFKKVRQ